MKNIKLVTGSLTMALLATACAQPPMGPQVGVMPGPNKPFHVFQDDDAICRQFASNQTSGQAQQANNQAVGSAILGGVLGAGLGAAAGGGTGAGIGAASGVLAGSAIGAGMSSNRQLSIQQQYDIAYSQCMFSRGNQVPGFSPRQGPGGPPRAPGY
jgi:hypothetical protein